MKRVLVVVILTLFLGTIGLFTLWTELSSVANMANVFLAVFVFLLPNTLAFVLIRNLKKSEAEVASLQEFQDLFGEENVEMLLCALVSAAKASMDAVRKRVEHAINESEVAIRIASANESEKREAEFMELYRRVSSWMIGKPQLSRLRQKLPSAHIASWAMVDPKAECARHEKKAA